MSTIDNTCNNDTQDKVKITGFIFRTVLICMHPNIIVKVANTGRCRKSQLYTGDS
jgi:hypothetical protein